MVIILSVSGVVLVFSLTISALVVKYFKSESELAKMTWKVKFNEIRFNPRGKGQGPSLMALGSTIASEQVR